MTVRLQSSCTYSNLLFHPPMRHLFIYILLLLGVHALYGEQAAPLLYLVGDSTMSHKPLDLPERGWGMALNGLLKDPAMAQNHAVNGRSTKSFINEGRWARVVNALAVGDFVLIEFGHNDEKIEKPSVGTNPQTEFRDNLKRFVADIRGKGAIPVLATPIARRKFDRDGKLLHTHGAYPDVIRSVAKTENVELIDLERATEGWLQKEGPEPSKRFFMWIAKGSNAKMPDGKEDDTHLVEAGAQKVAELAVSEIRENNLSLSRWVK